MSDYRFYIGKNGIEIGGWMMFYSVVLLLIALGFYTVLRTPPKHKHEMVEVPPHEHEMVEHTHDFVEHSHEVPEHEHTYSLKADYVNE